MVGDVLRNVVRFGTGRRAASALPLGGAPLPLAGKTGTTNDYRNAAFLGMVPKVTDGAARWGQGYTVAVYVGYDDNRSMRRGATRVQGASGALPAWLGIARGLASAGLLGTGGASEYTPSPGLVRVEVAPGVEGAPGPTALVPEGYRRMFAPYAEPPSEAAGGPATEPPPTEPLTLPAFEGEGEPSVWDGI
jgi:membrane peptidoglycan carboxypeptidase